MRDLLSIGIAASVAAFTLMPTAAHANEAHDRSICIYSDQPRVVRDAACTRVIAANPDERVYRARGILRYDQGRTAEALNDFDAMISLTQDPADEMLRSITLVQLGRYKEAAEAYTRMLAASLPIDLHLGALGGRGEALALAGDHAAALPDLNMFIELARDRPGMAGFVASTLERRGIILQETGKTADAIADFAEATRLDPDVEYPWFGLGRLYDEQGRPAEAASAYSRYLELRPRNSVVLELAWTHHRADQYQQGLAAAQQSMRIAESGPKNAVMSRQEFASKALRVRAFSHLFVGNFSEAAHDFAKLAATPIRKILKEEALRLEFLAAVAAGQDIRRKTRKGLAATEQGSWNEKFLRFLAGDESVETIRQRLLKLLEESKAKSPSVYRLTEPVWRRQLIELYFAAGLIAEAQGKTAEALGWQRRALAIEMDPFTPDPEYPSLGVETRDLARIEARVAAKAALARLEDR